MKIIDIIKTILVVLLLTALIGCQSSSSGGGSSSNADASSDAGGGGDGGGDGGDDGGGDGGDANTAPVATDLAVSTDEDTAKTITLTASDDDEDTLTFTLVTQPTNGSVTCDSDGSCTYTPTADYNGSDSFTFTANDGTVDSAAATVTITVNSINDLPSAETGSDKLGLVGRVIALAGSGTDPVEGSSVTYSWSQVSGPTTALDDSTIATPILIPWSAGVLKYNLVVNDGTSNSTANQVTVTVHAISSGGDHTLAVKPDGTLWTWGENSDGQLGLGDSDDRYTPVQVSDPTGVDSANSSWAAVTTGSKFSVLLRTDGTVWSTGADGSGQLGNGTDGNTDTITPVCEADATSCSPGTNQLTGIKGVSTGELHALVVTSGGAVLSWGDGNGNLGNGGTASSNTPVAVCALNISSCSVGTDNLTGVAVVEAGYQNSFALLDNGDLLSWGLNDYGELGNGESQTPKDEPGRVCAVGATAPCSDFLTNVKSVSSGGYHVVAVQNDGTLLAWGADDDNYGNLGQADGGALSESYVPIEVIGTDGVNTDSDCMDVRAASFANVATKTDGSVWAFGDVGGFALGNGDDQTDKDYPVPVCSSDAEGPCSESNHQLQNLAGVVPGGAKNAGNSYYIVLLPDESLLAWGNHSNNGNLGTGDFTEIAPQSVSPPSGESNSGWEQVASSKTHTIAIKDGAVYAWGDNSHGELGTGDNFHTTTPRKVCALGETSPCTSFLTGVQAVSAGSNSTYHAYSIALLDNGEVLAWGNNNNNVLGQTSGSSTTNYTIPRRVCAVGSIDCSTNYLSGVSAISSGGEHSLALLSSTGGVVAWGRNSDGQLGIGSAGADSAPAIVCDVGQTSCSSGSSDLTGVDQVAAGFFSSSFARKGENVLSWGNPGTGKLGNSFTSSTPSQPFPGYVCDVGVADGSTCTPGNSNILTGIAQIAAGHSHALALRNGANNSAVVGWGYGNYGVLGNADSGNTVQHAPVPVCDVGAGSCTVGSNDLTGVTAIWTSQYVSSGRYFSFAKLSNGKLLGFGNNGKYELGDTTNTRRDVPVYVCDTDATDCATDPFTGAVSLSVSGTGPVVVTSDGSLFSWGENLYGSLGRKDAGSGFIPTAVSGY